jgi:hypothetical protein
MTLCLILLALKNLLGVSLSALYGCRRELCGHTVVPSNFTNTALDSEINCLTSAGNHTQLKNILFPGCLFHIMIAIGIDYYPKEHFKVTGTYSGDGLCSL